MKLFKRHIQKQRDHSDLPEELSWENMSVGIENKMNKAHRVNGVGASSNLLKGFDSLLFGVIVILTSMIFYSVVKDDNSIKSDFLTSHKELIQQNEYQTSEHNARGLTKIENIENSVTNKSPELNSTGELSNISDLNKNENRNILDKPIEKFVSKRENREEEKKDEEVIDGKEIRDAQNIVNTKETNPESSSVRQIISKNKSKNKSENNVSSAKGRVYAIGQSVDLDKQTSSDNSSNESLVQHRNELVKQNMEETGVVSTEMMSDDKTEQGKLNNEIENQKNIIDKDINQDVVTVEVDNKQNTLAKLTKSKSLDLAYLSSAAILPLDAIAYKVDIPPYVITKAVEEFQRSKFSLGILAGTNLWRLNLSNLEEGSDKQNNEVALLGSFGAVRGEYNISNSLFISTGIQYSELRSRFNKVAIRNYTENLQGQLIEQKRNPITGVVRDIFGTAEIKVTETRMIQHYNKFKAVSIPVVLGYRIDTGNLRHSIGLGAVYNLSMASTGKTETEGQVLDYTLATDSPYESATAVSPVLELGIDYSVFQDLRIGLNVQYQHNIKNWNKTESFFIKPRILNIGFMVSKSL